MSTNAIYLEEIDLTFKTEQPINVNAQHFLENIKKINKLPFNQGDFYFSDNVWDFSPYKITNIPNSKLRFNFTKCCEVFRDELKFFVLFKLLEKNSKIQTIQRHCEILSIFLNKASLNGYFHVKDLNDYFVENFIRDMSNSKAASTIEQHKTAIKHFYKYYSANFANILSSDTEAILEDKNYRRLNAEKTNNKIADIPQEYYNNFLSATIKILDNKDESNLIKSIAAFYLILSQTGLRISECLALEIDNLQTVSIFNGETAYYLNYKTWKRVKGNNVYQIEKTYVNELTKKGYDFLTELYKEKRENLNLKYLFLGTDRRLNFPLDKGAFEYYKYTYFAHLNNYFPTINLPENTYKNINNIKIYKVKDKFKNVKTIAAPSNHQFRVHVCTDLYNKGVPLKYIEKFMSHLSSEMADYYVRPTKQNPQENMDFSLDTLQKIVTGETKLLGGNGGLQAKINEFIEKNHYNVETDLQTICEKLAENIPIRQKTGGVCIKSSQLRECSKDSKTNEFYCAYGVCPNIFHFYYMADVSYRQAKELAETIELNKGRGLIRQVQKETNMLQHVVKVKLIPELDELKNVINKKGVQSVLMEYPDLKDIVENLEEIYKETELWLQK